MLFYFGCMKPRRPPDWHGPDWHGKEIANGFLVLAVRVAAVFAIIGLGYSVYELFGMGWFHVFVFAAIAFRLHWELRQIERMDFNEEDERREAEEEASHPFRKR